MRKSVKTQKIPIVIERLKTKETETKTKMRNIECYKRNHRIDIEHNDMSNLLYEIL